MSSRKTKQNDENLNPISSKRAKITDLETQRDSPIKSSKSSNSAWIAAKLDSTSSPSGLSNEYLEEMGVGILDSEESSSSSASAMNFAAALKSVTTSSSQNTDENCNEAIAATSNLEAPKIKLQQQHLSSPLDIEFDLSDDGPPNMGNVLFVSVPQSTSKTSKTHDVSLSSFEIFTDESCQQMLERKNWPKHKAVASVLADRPSAYFLSSKRSPLATVICNKQEQQQEKHLQQSEQIQNTSPDQQYMVTALNTAATNTPSNITLLEAPTTTTITTQQSNMRLETSLSPQQPTTSRQAALLRNQQQQKTCQQQNRDSNIVTSNNNNNNNNIDNFFIFRNQQLRDRACNTEKAIDHFSFLSDEIILQVFKWLPKKTLLRCGLVCRRFYQCSTDESLWSRLDLGGRSLRPEVIQTVLTRGVVVMRLAQTNFREPVFPLPAPHLTEAFQSKLQYLDLSLAQIDKMSLRILLSYCRQLKKLSLEHVPLNNDICNEIAENTNLEALNLAMCTGLEAWSIRKMFKPLKNLNSLNISWTNLSVDAVTSLVTHVPSNLIRLNVAGCRKTMFDTHVASLGKRCPQLIELDLSDCTGLTGFAITILSKFKMLEYLSLSRCYLIPAMAYLDLKNVPTLAFLDVFGTLNDEAINLLERSLTGLGINKFVHSSVARPTVGTRRTSIWGLRTRD